MANKKSDAEMTQEMVAEKAPKKVEKSDERVAVMLPFIEGEDTQLSVTINGQTDIIPRGRTVKVRRAVAKLLENNNIQMMAARENEQKLKNQRTDL